MIDIKKLRSQFPDAAELTDFELTQAVYPTFQRYYPKFDEFAKAAGVDVGGKWGNRASAAIDSYQANAYGIGEAFGSEWAGQRRKANELEAQNARQWAQHQGAVMSYKDIGGVGDAADWLGGLAIDSAPYLAEAAVGGLVGRGLAVGARAGLSVAAEMGMAAPRQAAALSRASTAGAVAASYPSAVGDILSSQREQNGQMDILSAAALALPYAGLNAVGLEGAVARGMPRAFGGLDNMAGVRGGASRAATNMAIGAVGEGASETGQEFINQIGRNVVDPTAGYTGEDAIERYKESFIGGAALGGVVSGGMGGWRRSDQWYAGQEELRRQAYQQMLDEKRAEEERAIAAGEVADILSRVHTGEKLDNKLIDRMLGVDTSVPNSGYTEEFWNQPSNTYVAGEDSLEENLTLGENALVVNAGADAAPIGEQTETAAADAWEANSEKFNLPPVKPGQGLKYREVFNDAFAKFEAGELDQTGLDNVTEAIRERKTPLARARLRSELVRVEEQKIAAAREAEQNKGKVEVNPNPQVLVYRSEPANVSQPVGTVPGPGVGGAVGGPVAQGGVVADGRGAAAGRGGVPASAQGPGAAPPQVGAVGDAQPQPAVKAPAIGVRKDASGSPMISRSLDPKTGELMGLQVQLDNGKEVTLRNYNGNYVVDPRTIKAVTVSEDGKVSRAAGYSDAVLAKMPKNLVVSGSSEQALLENLGKVLTKAEKDAGYAKKGGVKAQAQVVADRAAKEGLTKQQLRDRTQALIRKADPVDLMLIKAAAGFDPLDEGWIETGNGPLKSPEIAQMVGGGMTAENVRKRLEPYMLGTEARDRLASLSSDVRGGENEADISEDMYDLADIKEAMSGGSDEVSYEDSNSENSTVVAAADLNSDTDDLAFLQSLTKDQQEKLKAANKFLRERGEGSTASKVKAKPVDEAAAAAAREKLEAHAQYERAMLAQEAARQEKAPAPLLRDMLHHTIPDEAITKAAADWDKSMDMPWDEVPDVHKAVYVRAFHTYSTGSGATKAAAGNTLLKVQDEVESKARDAAAAGGEGAQRAGGQESAVAGVPEGDEQADGGAQEAPRKPAQAPVVIVKKRRTIDKTQKSVGTADGDTHTAESLEDSLATFMDVDTLGRRVHIISSRRDLRDPADIRAHDTAGAVAWVRNGHVYLVADRIQVGKERGIFLHEAGSHAGLERILSKSLFNHLAKNVAKWAKADNGSMQSEIAKRAMERAKAAGSADDKAEHIAYFIEEAVNAGVRPSAFDKFGEVGAFVRSVWAAFKRALRALGFRPSALTMQDVVDMAYAAARIPVAGGWHGTTAKVQQFRTRYMGSGEGNQAYGWGMYFSELRSVAENYRDSDKARKRKKLAIVGDVPTFADGTPIDSDGKQALYEAKLLTDAMTVVDNIGVKLAETIAALEEKKAAARRLREESDAAYAVVTEKRKLGYGGDYDAAAKRWMDASTEAFKAEYGLPEVEKKLTALKAIRDRGVKERTKDVDGRLYATEFIVKSDEWLDWTKPLSQQSAKVRAALSELGFSSPQSTFARWIVAEPTGESIYQAIRDSAGSDKAASQKLNSLGIKGVRVPVNNTRGGTYEDGTNYVVFDEKNVIITARNPEDNLSKSVQRSYVGESAEKTNKVRLAAAKAMAAAGRDPEYIRKSTGWFQGKYDGKWRTEIDDSAAAWAVDFDGIEESKLFDNPTLKLSDVLKHDELFEQYPELKDVKFVKKAGFFDFNRVEQGSFNPKTNTLQVTPYAEDPLSTALHEIQHWIQTKESFEPGGNKHSALMAMSDEQIEEVVDFFVDDQTEVLDYAVKRAEALARAGQSPELRAYWEAQGSDAPRADVRKIELALREQLFGTDSWFKMSELDRQIALGLDSEAAFQRAGDEVVKDIIDAQTNIAEAKSGDRKRIADVIKKSSIAYDAYQRVAGEIEARDVQARRNMSPAERYDTAPYSSESIQPGRAVYTGKLRDAESSESNVQFSIAATGYAADIRSRMPEKASDAMATIKDTFQKFFPAALTNTQLVEQYGKDIKTLPEYVGLQQRMTTERMRQSLRTHEISVKWDKLAPAVKTQLNLVMQRATLLGMHPDRAINAEGNKHINAADVEAKAKFDKLTGAYRALPADAKVIYEEARSELDKQWAERRDAYASLVGYTFAKRQAAAMERGDPDAVERLEKEYEEAVAEYDKELAKIKGPYFPLMRFGDYLVIAESPEFKATKEKAYNAAGAERREANQKLDKLRQDPRHYSVTAHPTKGAANKAQREMAAKYGADNVRQDMADQHIDGARLLSQQTLDSITELVSAQFDKTTAGQLNEAMTSMFLRSLPEMHALQREAARKGVEGASEDMLRAFSATGQQSAFYTSRLRFASEMTDTLFRMKQEVKGDSDRQHIHREMERRAALDMRHKATPIQDMAASVSWIYHLAVSPSFMLINATQPWLVTGPLLGSKFGVGKATSALAAATSDAMAMLKAARFKDVDGRLTVDLWSGINESTLKDQDERRMLRELMERGVVDEGAQHDLNMYAEDSSRKLAKFNRYMGWTTQQIELLNRSTAAIAAYRLARKANMSHEAATEYAYNTTLATQFDYSAEGTARLMRDGGPVPMAKLVFQFRRYQQGMLYLLGSNIKRLGNPEERAEAAKALALFSMTAAMSAGVMGLPFLGVALWAWGLALDDDDPEGDPETRLRNLLYDMTGDKTYADTLAKGLPALWGWDLSKRIGLADIASPFPMAKFDGKTGKEQMGELLLSALGPVGGLAAKFYDGYTRISEGDFAKGFEKLTPKFMSDVSKGLRYATEGLTEGNGAETGAEVSGFDALSRGLGIAPTTESNYYEGTAAIRNLDKAIKDRMSRIGKEFKRGLRDGDVAKARQMIAEFNADHPKTKITPKQESTWRKEVQQEKLSRAQGVKMNQGRLAPLNDVARFATDEDEE